MNTTPDHITTLKTFEVFVFGSNTVGRHGAGAAKQALSFGAKFWQGEGLMCNSYALPTKAGDRKGPLHTLPLERIQQHVDRFLACAESRPDLEFLVTPVGTGLAGYHPQCLAPLFLLAAKPNITLPQVFMDCHPLTLVSPWKWRQLWFKREFKYRILSTIDAMRLARTVGCGDKCFLPFVKLPPGAPEGTNAQWMVWEIYQEILQHMPAGYQGFITPQ